MASVHGSPDTRPSEESFKDFDGTPIDITMRYTTPATLATLAERAEEAGLRIDELRVRDPYPFEHPTRRIYLLASAR